MDRKGKWVFVPLDKWEALPSSYYSMRVSSIYLALAFRTDRHRIEFCMRNNLLPPGRIRKAALEAWIDGAMALKSQLILYLPLARSRAKDVHDENNLPNVSANGFNCRSIVPALRP